jgi:hypothetical protein
MLIENVEPQKWYTVKEVSAILGPGVDRVRDWIYEGHLQAFIGPRTSKRRARVYRCAQIKGSEVIRFVEAHMTVRQVGKKLRMRAA